MFVKDGKIRARKANTKYPKLFAKLVEFMKNYDPEFVFDTITVNHNVVCKRHIDRGNKGLSYILFLGSFTGGELYNDDGLVLSRARKVVKFNGKIPHWNENITMGNKYSILWYSRYKNMAL
tara:strand:+ start:132 stop:494 length:363 start_codon:yes stop_codon:yes gene_type:complete